MFVCASEYGILNSLEFKTSWFNARLRLQALSSQGMLFTPNVPALEFGSTGNSYIIIVGSLASDIRPQDIVQCINYRAGSLETLKILEQHIL